MNLIKTINMSQHYVYVLRSHYKIPMDKNKMYGFPSYSDLYTKMFLTQFPSLPRNLMIFMLQFCIKRKTLGLDLASQGALI